MIRLLLQKIGKPLFVWMAARFSAAPKKEVVFKSLSRLYKSIGNKKGKKGIVLDINTASDKFIIFSDQHKGAKDDADDFANNEAGYIAALAHYNKAGFHFINLGDAEELWKYKADKVIPCQENALRAEAAFQQENRYFRVFGNHDLIWKNRLDVSFHLKKNFKMPLPVYEGILLQATNDTGPLINIFLAHGHQGDTMSDNNAFSSWVVAHIWAPLQRLLDININTPSNDPLLRDKHNRMMYDWCSHKKNLLLVTGHTHKPVFASGRYAHSDTHKIDTGEKNEAPVPCYFNTGCCCFDDGDITGIEIEGGYIRLIKWHSENNIPARILLEEKNLADIVEDMQHT
jgi:UDP-2,3-diacylglucosamine pyrophosphatase LpxH